MFGGPLGTFRNSGILGRTSLKTHRRTPFPGQREDTPTLGGETTHWGLPLHLHFCTSSVTDVGLKEPTGVRIGSFLGVFVPSLQPEVFTRTGQSFTDGITAREALETPFSSRGRRRNTLEVRPYRHTPHPYLGT